MIENDPIGNDPQNTDLQPANNQYLAYHNSSIIGIFDNQSDATDALQGYQMNNNIDINDVLDVVQITPIQQ